MKRNTLRIYLLLILVSGVLALSAYIPQHFISTGAKTKKRLPISAVIDEAAKYTTIKSEELGGNYENNIYYYNLANVNVEISDKVYPLEKAIRNKYITVEEIFAYARIDARNGICTEKYESKNGLTHFIYCYPEFDLRVTYDIYETPDGKSHLINDIGLYEPGTNVPSYYTDTKTGEAIDLEDWGLTFEYVSATSYSVTLNYTQYSGQHIGDLIVEYFSIYTADNFDIINRLGGINSIDQYLPIPLKQNTTSQIIVDWTNIYGLVPSGKYIIRLHLRDIFDKSQVHPLMKDFSDTLHYDIPITIP